MGRLYLASASPRRVALLAQLDLPFQTIKPTNEEHRTPSGSLRAIAKIVRKNALGKAQSVAAQLEEGLVISGDTLVVTAEGQVLDKPETPERALRMLHQLVGTWHRVISAVAMVDVVTKTHQVRHTSARVWFRKVSEDVLHRYVATGEPLDKAGAYAIQGRGSFFITRVTGSYTAVVGLPLELAVTMLATFGIYPWERWKEN